MIRVFANCPVEQTSILVQGKSKFDKWYLMPPSLKLSILRYG